MAKRVFKPRKVRRTMMTYDYVSAGNCILDDEVYADAVWLVLSQTPQTIEQLAHKVTGSYEKIDAALVSLWEDYRATAIGDGWARFPDARLPAPNRPAKTFSTQTPISATSKEAGL